MPEHTNNRKNPDQTSADEHPQRRLLPEYAAALLLKNEPTAQEAKLATHIAACRDCRRELDELLELASPFYDGTAELVRPPVSPDLSFLPRARKTPPETGGAAHWRRLIIQFSQDLLRGAQLPRLQGAPRGHHLYHYKQQPEGPDSVVASIDIFAENDLEGPVCVRVSLDAPARDPLDQGDITVRLRAGAATYERNTDAAGTVDFQPIDQALLPTLRVEILLDQAQG